MNAQRPGPPPSVGGVPIQMQVPINPPPEAPKAEADPTKSEVKNESKPKGESK